VSKNNDDNDCNSELAEVLAEAVPSTSIDANPDSPSVKSSASSDPRSFSSSSSPMPSSSESPVCTS
jgi:hypothetical protein